MRKANVLVTFDVDSTLLSLESLDAVLKKALEMQQNKKLAQESFKKVHEITQQGMNGQLSLLESIQQRLSIVHLDATMIAQTASVLQQNAISAGFPAMLSKLRQFPEVAVHAISGGFTEIITPLLTGEMGFSAHEIHANHLIFDPSEGGRAKLDAKNSVLLLPDAKALRITQLRQYLGASWALHIGDGITDARAAIEGAADEAWGFFEYANRPKEVREQFSRSFEDSSALETALLKAVLEQLPQQA